ncbi:hypothetical protein VNI00_006132 [Paramarasmius palmivorus]|uniref:Uncharacterized protein n=1 Tax=Paramarasmius palmivorus TaxID=297713 RepID=A0AAW0D859_9AGAR
MQSVNLFSRNTPQKTAAVREGLRMVRSIMASDTSKDGLTTSQIYQIAVKKKPNAEFKSLLKEVRLSAAKVEQQQATNGQSGSLKAPPPAPPRPLHPLKSMTFLKREVLPILEGNKEITLKRVMRVPTVTEQAPETTKASKKTKGKGRNESNANAAPSPVQVYLWKNVPKPKKPVQGEVNWGPYAKSFKQQWWEVGTGEDLGYLSRRRRRARVDKIGREVETAKVVKRAVTKAEQLRVEALVKAREQKRRERVDMWYERVRVLRKAKIEREKAEAQAAGGTP